jgi:hypothetical protein
MSRALSFLACLAFGFATAEAAIDMTPALRESTENGITSKHLVFKDGAREITYELPSQWTHRSVGDSVKLIPPSGTMVDIVMKAIPLTSPQPLDEKGVAAVHEHFLRDVPPAAQALTVASEQLNTVPFGATNCEITATYQALGEVFVRRALYINLPDRQLIFRLSARKSEFENLWRTFRGSILSWHWTDPVAQDGPKTASN